MSTAGRHGNRSRARAATWNVVAVLALLPTIPAFYLQMLEPSRSAWAVGGYGVAALVLALEGWWARRSAEPVRVWQWLLVVGLVGAALLPGSQGSTAALLWRGAVAALTLARFALALRPWLTRGGLPWLLMSALATLGLCGAGFWWLEPRALTFGDGLWLAFTTAATVGYGDIVPSTAAAKVFSVFVVLLGFALLSTVTAAIAARWIETEERRIEREILRDMHRQLQVLHSEVAALRHELKAGGARDRPDTSA